jgi:hypothetical protein
MTQRTLNLYSYPLAARCNRAEPAEREKGEGPWFDLILSAETFYTAEVADKVSKAVWAMGVCPPRNVHARGL